MTTEIVAPTPIGLLKIQPNEIVIDALRHWLAEAKLGEVQGIIILGVSHGGGHRRSSVGDMTNAQAMLLAGLVMHDALEHERTEEALIDRPDPQDSDE